MKSTSSLLAKVRSRMQTKRNGPKPDLMAEYRAQLRARADAADGGLDAGTLQRLLEKAGVPVQAIEALAKGGLKNSRTLDAATEFGRKGQHKILLALLGPWGRGKTLASVWLIAERFRRDGVGFAATGQVAVPAMFVPAARLTRVSDFKDIDGQWLEELERVALLVVDDAGDEGTAHGRDVLVNLLLARYARGRRSVVTSNLLPDSFRKRYGEALWERIVEGGIAPDLTGKSFRGAP